MKFRIDHFELEPTTVLQFPNGEVLYAKFIGATAHVWIKIEEGDRRTMGAIVLPSGGPFLLEKSPGFEDAVHAISFHKESLLKTKLPTPAVFHLFVFPPSHENALLMLDGADSTN